MKAFLVGNRVKNFTNTGTVVKEFTMGDCPPNYLPVEWDNGAKSYHPIEGLFPEDFQPKHLPVPYHVEFMGDIHYIYNKQQAVCAVHNKLLSREQNAANAEFICKACNAYKRV
jgi:hypothetical protein